MRGLLSYAPGDTVLHRMNPLIKLLMAIVICASCFMTQSHLYLAALIALCLGLGAIGGIRAQTLRIFINLLKLSVILFLIQVFFVRQGNVLLALPLGLAVTDAGISFSTQLCMRLMGATLPLTIMLTLTQLSDLTRELVGRLHLPFRYAFALTTAIRFIPVLSEEMSGIMQAQTARGVEFDGGLVKKIRLLLPMCVPLLVSSVRRIEQSAISAELRGFHLRGYTSSYKRYPFRMPDACAVLLCALILAGGALWPFVLF